MRVLDKKEENTRAVKSFRERLKEVSFKLENMEWGFPNGDRVV